MAAVAAVVAVVIANNDDPSYKADSDLEGLLLTSDNFPTGFNTSILSEEELNQQNQSQSLPEDIQPAECAELLDECGNTTFSEDGTSGTLTFSKLSGIEGDGFALRMTIEAGGTEITLGVAVTKVAKHVVIFTGGTSGEFDETEFVQLATAANDKVNAEL